MKIDMAQFHQAFFEESLEGLETMEATLLALGDGAADAEAVNAIFRAAHSIKGGAGTFGFSGIAGFTHHVETLLEQVRSGQRSMSPPLLDLMLTSVDVLRNLLQSTRQGVAADDGAAARTEAALRAALADAGAPAPVAGGPADSGAGPGGWRVRFVPAPGLLRTGNEPYRLLRELQALGDARVRCDASALPAFEDLDPELCYLRWEIEVRGPAATREAIVAVFEWVEGDCELQLEPLGRPGEVVSPAPGGASPAAAPADAGRPPAGGTARAAAESSSLRVSTDKVDALVNLVGELVITQSMLSQLGQGADAPAGWLERLQAGLAQLERNTREIQDSVMRIRMVPIGHAFNRFPRLVHDLSTQLGKRVELRMTGEGTELDKTVIEKIGDPLVHLVRNALDHGIELPEARRAAGKPEAGVLRLDACHKGGAIVIEIGDDGAGLVRQRLRAKAVERGLVAPEATLTDEQVLDLIFQPGFSTAAVVSDLSGRGVGMDVVRRNIKALGGSVEVRSTEGVGTTFVIRLPLTLAILDGQLARLGRQTFVIPLLSIVESLKVDPRHLAPVAGGGEVFRLREEYIPVLRGQALFGPSLAGTTRTELLVVLEAEGRRLGLLVDELLGQQQVVIKSLERNFQAVPGFSGATILGDGTVALILDVPGVVQHLTQRATEPRRNHPAAIVAA